MKSEKKIEIVITNQIWFVLTRLWICFSYCSSFFVPQKKKKKKRFLRFFRCNWRKESRMRCRIIQFCMDRIEPVDPATIHSNTDIHIYIFVWVGRRLLFKQVSLNDKWQERFTIFRDIRSISLNFSMTSSLLIFRKTKESHRLGYLFGQLYNIYIYSCRCLHKGSIPLRSFLRFRLDEARRSWSQSGTRNPNTNVPPGSCSSQTVHHCGPLKQWEQC